MVEKEKLENFLELLSDPAIIVDNQLRIQWANRTFFENFAHKSSFDELIGKQCHSFFAKSQRNCRCCPVLSSIAGKESCTCDQVIGLQGKIWSITAHPILNDEGEVFASFEIFTSKTDSSTNSETRTVAADSGQQLSSVPNDHAGIQTVIEAIQGKISGLLAHTLNNRLTNISINADLALMDIDEPREVMKQNLHSIKDAVSKAADIPRVILSMTKRDRDSENLCDLREVITRSLELITAIRGFTPQFTCEQEDFQAQLSSRPLLEMLLLYILLEGARKFDPGSPALSVSLGMEKADFSETSGSRYAFIKAEGLNSYSESFFPTLKSLTQILNLGLCTRHDKPDCLKLIFTIPPEESSE